MTGSGEASHWAKGWFSGVRGHQSLVYSILTNIIIRIPNNYKPKVARGRYCRKGMANFQNCKNAQKSAYIFVFCVIVSQFGLFMRKKLDSAAMWVYNLFIQYFVQSFGTAAKMKVPGGKYAWLQELRPEP
jgi:hypothetical protein